MYKKYPKQMPKLMQLLIQEYIPKIPKSAIASTIRLETYLQENIGKGQGLGLHSGAKLKR